LAKATSRVEKSERSGIIKEVKARQIIDSRGNPTVEVEARTWGGAYGRAAVPSGASTGSHEALELRDGDMKLYRGKSVLKAVRNVNEEIARAIVGRSCLDQEDIDETMIDLDGTSNKRRLGANAILGVSMAVAKVAAVQSEVPLYRWLSSREKYSLPWPMMNVINGGAHAGTHLSVQEFLLEPVGADRFSESIRVGVEIYHVLREVLRDRYGVTSTNVGDEGGYAPPMEKVEQALDALMKAISKAGYDDSMVKVGIDSAATNFYDERSKMYEIDGRKMPTGELVDYYVELTNRYPILTIEDPFHEEDFEGFAIITAKVGQKVMIIGDDVYVTNPRRIERGVNMRCTNSVLIKPNQIGTVTETIRAIEYCDKVGMNTVVSHRSGETEDTFISHLATAAGSRFIKAGAPARGERVAKYNELMRIEEELSAAR
jgi:enolase